MLSNHHDAVCPFGWLLYSMSPEKRVVLTPPRVNSPPGCSDLLDVLSARASQKAIIDWSSWLLEASACQNGVALVAARLGNASPMRPLTSGSPPKKLLLIWSTTRNSCLGTVKPARETVSAPSVPITVPEPYGIFICPFEPEGAWKLLLELVSNFGAVDWHCWQLEEGSQKSDEPVSKTTKNCSAGVPTLACAT
jgi:hypothetical protein